MGKLVENEKEKVGYIRVLSYTYHLVSSSAGSANGGTTSSDGPVFTLSSPFCPMQMEHLPKELHRRIVGQHKAVEAVASAIRQQRLGCSDSTAGPVASFLFLGTPGATKMIISIQPFLQHPTQKC